MGQRKREPEPKPEPPNASCVCDQPPHAGYPAWSSQVAVDQARVRVRAGHPKCTSGRKIAAKPARARTKTARTNISGTHQEHRLFPATTASHTFFGSSIEPYQTKPLSGSRGPCDGPDGWDLNAVFVVRQCYREGSTAAVAHFIVDRPAVAVQAAARCAAEWRKVGQGRLVGPYPRTWAGADFTNGTISVAKCCSSLSDRSVCSNGL